MYKFGAQLKHELELKSKPELNLNFMWLVSISGRSLTSKAKNSN